MIKLLTAIKCGFLFFIIPAKAGIQIARNNLDPKLSLPAGRQG